MDWERFDRIGNRAQFPFTVGGYIGWAYALWPKGAVLFGSPKNVSWMAVTAVGVLCLGALSTASHLGLLRSGQAGKELGQPKTSPAQKDDKSRRLLQLGTPTGVIGSVNDLLVETEHRFGQLESSYWKLIEAWNGWINAARQAQQRQLKEGLSWERAFPSERTEEHKRAIGSAFEVFSRRLTELQDMIDVHVDKLGGSASE